MNLSPKKTRLDNLIVSLGLIESREKARALILAGEVLVNGTRVSKAGTFIRADAKIEVLQKNPYVGRGGLKLEGAIIDLKIDVKGRTAMDVGASTGGFTDCLLQHGAKKVYAIDVGYGQIALKLRHDPRVVLMEKTNIRHLEQNAVRHKIDLVTIDVSFISLAKVLPKALEFLAPDGEIIALIKPQFEAARKDVGKGGVVRDEARRLEVIERVKKDAVRIGLETKGLVKSGLKGPKGNVEYFIRLRRPLDP